MTTTLPTLPKRQIHLDFHTSPFIPGVAADFDAETFAAQMAAADVESVTVFAKCHHGMAYYPSKVGPVHPALAREDLLGEMIEALHRRGIRCPIYTTVVWEEHVADTHPEWRQMTANGEFCIMEGAADMQTPQPGRWRFNSFAHPEYQDYFEAHLTEILERYDVDGFFIDILFHHEQGCFNPQSIVQREALSLLEDTPANNARFESMAQQQFAERFTRFIQGRAPQASVFYNSTNRAYLTGEVGWAARVQRETHNEIESLPSGFWGYHHFPRLGRQAMMWSERPFLGMTGRFQKMWGDFGGLKPQAALDYEAFRAQALGGGISVGDQMYPNGKLDPAVYARIGTTFAQVKAAEPFYAGSQPCPQIGILLATKPGDDEAQTGKSEEGTVMLLEELRYDAAVLDDTSELDRYEAIILPDTTRITPALKTKLSAYYGNGGKLLLSAEAGFDAAGQWALDFLPLQVGPREALYPSFWKVAFAEEADSYQVIYNQGRTIAQFAGDRLLDHVPPYFKRDDLHFCSHFQTPPDAQAEAIPACVGNGQYAYFAHPIFREYRQTGNPPIRPHVAHALTSLGLTPMVQGDLSPHVQVYPRRQENDLLLTLLHYIPCRKALDIDVIERAQNFAGQTLHLPGSDQVLTAAGEALPAGEQDHFILPATTTGRVLLRVPDYFDS